MNKLNPKLSLSKSLYTKGLQCEKSLWLKKYKPEVLTPPDALTQAIFKEGHVVGGLACKLFPDGKKIHYKGPPFKEEIALTQQLLAEGVKDIFEATFEYDDILVMVDILHQKEDGSFEIYEVKSSTWGSGKKFADIEKYIFDVSIQHYVLNGLGYNVSDTYITLLNKDYVMSTKLDIKQLFHSELVTEQVLDLQSQIPSTIESFRETLKDTENEPNINIGSHCKKSKKHYECDAYEYCWKKQRSIPDYSVFNIFTTNSKSLQLYKEGIIEVEDIPENSISTDIQRLYVDVWKHKKSFIDKEKIKQFIDTISYPIYYLDFETLTPPVPEFIGTSPRKRYPFQYSLHIEHEDGRLLEEKFLAPPGEDPREKIAKKLTEDIPKNSCVVAYSMSVEKGVIKELADLYPAYAEHLMNLHSNFVDLRKPFQSRYYLSPEMKKSDGLKTVLPILVPEMRDAYKNLDMVHDGGEAMNLYKKLGEAVVEGSDLEKINQYEQALYEYCKLDTLAMVKILKKLKQIIQY